MSCDGDPSDCCEEINPMSEADLDELWRLLKWYCSHELDQHDHWKVSTSHGNVFISIERRTKHPKAFDPLPNSPTK